MGGNESEQVQKQSTPKEVQEATQVMRKVIEDQGHYPTILISKYNNLVTLITWDKGGLGLFYYLWF